MNLQTFYEYVQEQKENGLIKFDATTEIDEYGNFNVVKSKCTYSVETETEADALINDFRKQDEFVGCDKKYKQGKMNKAGEVVRPDQYLVVIKVAY